MGYYEIEGGHSLNGIVTVQGAKNSVLPILAATLLTEGEYTIENCPDISDVAAALDILQFLGCTVSREENKVVVDTGPVCRSDIPNHLMRKMRSSVIFLGALLARMGKAKLSMPGGCELGPRPIDLHLSALSRMGVQIEERWGNLYCAAGELQGREICLAFPSVGATENIMLCACGCSGETVIQGAAREPEIEDLGRFLRTMGADISGAGTSRICVRGGMQLHPTRFFVMGDRIAAATYLCAAATTGGRITLNGVHAEDITAVLDSLAQAGCRIENGRNELTLTSEGMLRGIAPVRTAPYPGFPTDGQAILMAALAKGWGSTMFVENMFESRYGHVDELHRLGAEIQVSGRVAVVTGKKQLHGAEVYSPDLRGGAALVVAGLAAKGTTKVYAVEHIQRGYDHLVDRLCDLGAAIRLIE